MCDKLDFEELFNDASVLGNLNTFLDTSRFRDILCKLTKNEEFINLNCEYYSCDEFNTKFNKFKSNIEISVLHLNIRSLNSKIREFCTLVHLLDINFDAIILSEVWKYNLEFYSNILDGYKLFYKLPTLSAVGGVAIFVKSSIHSKIREDFTLSSTAVKCESLFLEIRKNKTKYILGGIYRHPNQSIDLFADTLQMILNKISSSKSPCILAGDFNIDLIKSETNTCTGNYLKNLLLHNFLPVVLIPTR